MIYFSKTNDNLRVTGGDLSVRILRISVLPGGDRRAKVNASRRGGGSAGFVWRYLGFGGGPRADAWVAGGWRFGRCGQRLRVGQYGGRRFGRGGLRGSGLLQLAESSVGLVMDTLEAGFVSRH